MREIKFRAWDNDKKQMLYQEDNTTRNNSVMECQIAFDELGYCVFVRYYGEDSCFEIKNTELMQYTGLKDKNGKEIFEGDIINTTVLGIDHAIIVEVKFIHGCFGFFTTKRKVYEAGAVLPVFAVLAPGVNVEVIGNIYENKNLLQD